MNNYLLIFLLFPLGLFAQSVSIDFGSTNSNYQYYNSNGEKLETINSDTDYSIGIYYYKNLGYNETYSLKTGLRYQGMNASGYSANVPLVYKTKFLSALAALEWKTVSIYTNRRCSSCPKIDFLTTVGLEAAKLLSGNQTIGNAQSYDLTNEQEFNGIFAGPVIGTGFQFELFTDTLVNVMYHKTWFLNSHQKPEKLNIDRTLISLGIKQSF